MARKGRKRVQKRIAAPRQWKIERKGHKFATKTIPGSHAIQKSIPLSIAIKEILGLAKNQKEVKFILKNGNIKVDGIMRKEKGFPIGLFDLVEIEKIGKKFRTIIDSKGRITLKEEKKEKKEKLCKVKQKTILKKGKTQLTTHDNRNILTEEKEIKIGDTIKITVPEQKIIKKISMEEGSQVLVIGGKHVGETAKIIKIHEGTMKRERLLDLETKEKKFQTTMENVFVIDSVVQNE